MPSVNILANSIDRDWNKEPSAGWRDTGKRLGSFVSWHAMLGDLHSRVENL